MRRFRKNRKFSGTCILLSLLFLAFSSQFPTMRTGAPGDAGTCAGCHQNNGSFTGQVNIFGLDDVDGGDVLGIDVEVEVLSGNPVRAGFSLVALDDSNNNAGEFLPGGDGAFVMAGGREYWGHSPAQNFGGGASVTWISEWEAPNINDDVTFYICSVLGNGSGTGGDRVECTSETITVTATTSVTVEIINETDVTCPDGDDGSAEASASDGTPPYSYEWSNGETTAIATNLDAGSHSVTVTDDNGDTAEATTSIDEPDDIELDGDIEDVSCFDEEDGMIDLDPTGGNGGFTCDWDVLGSGCFQTNLAADTYFVTVTDDQGCTEEFSITIEEPDEIELTLTSTNTSAANTTDGTATVSASGGTPGYDYDWSNGATTQTISNLAPGQYCVTVTDDNGCEETDCVTVGSGGCALGATSFITDVDCFGESTGLIEIDLSGSTPPVTFSWSTGTSDSSLQNIPAGTYAVTITDATSCDVVLSNLVVSQPNQIQLTITATDASAPNAGDGTASVSASGGTPGYDYNWSNGATTQTISNLAPGQYCVTVTDDNGCIETACVTVSGGACALAATSMISNVNCFGENTGMIGLAISGSSPPLSFSWSNGTSNSNLSNVPAGTYSVTVTDAATCDVVLSNLVVTQPDTLQVSLQNIQNASCDNTTDGAIMVDIQGGVGDYDLIWSNGAINDTTVIGTDTIINLPDTLVGLVPGLYSYTLFDGNNCLANGFYQVGNNDNVPPTLMVMETIVELDAAGNAAPVTFDMVDAGSFDNCGINMISFATPSFTCSDIGLQNFTAFATDANGNMSSANVTIQVVDVTAPVIDCSNSGMTVSTCNGVNYNLPSVVDNCDNVEPVLVSGFFPGAVFPVGTTTVVFSATDLCNNASSCSFDITVMNDLGADIAATDATCNEATGTITVQPTGGTPPYTVEPFGVFQGNLQAGNYNISVSDAGGCVFEQVVTVGQTDGPSLQTSNTLANCMQPNSGSITLNLSNGTPPYMLSINGDTPFIVNANQTIDNLVAGTYDLVIIDSEGCSVISSETVGMVSVPSVQTPAEIITNCPGETILVDFSATNTEFSFPGLPAEFGAGDHSIQAVHVPSGCGQTVTFSVRNPEPISISEILGTNNDACTFNPDEDLSIFLIGGTPPYDIAITLDPGGTVQGPYTAAVSDSQGCQANFAFDLPGLQFTELQLASEPTIVSCDGDIMLNFIVAGGCPPFTPNIQPDSILQAGQSHTLIVTDNIGQSLTEILIVEELEEVFLVSEQVTDVSAGQQGGVDIELGGGTGSFTFEWRDAAGNIISTEQNLTGVTEGGEVFLTVISDGCITEFSFVIGENSAVAELDETGSYVMLSPNPVQDIVLFTFVNGQPSSGLIYSVQGEIVKKLEITSDRMEVNLTDFAPGVYYTRLQFGEKIIVKQFVKL